MSSLVSALPLDNPGLPALYSRGCFNGTFEEFYSWRNGFYGDYVYNQCIQAKNSDLGTKEALPYFSVSMQGAQFILNYADMLDVYALFGSADFRFELPRGTTTVQVNDNFFASGGARFCKRFGRWIAGIEGQYLHSRLENYQFFQLTNAEIHHVSTSDSNGIFRTYQGGLGLTYEVVGEAGVVFSPYIGLKFTGALGHFQFKNNAESLKYKFRSDKSVGYVVGATTLLCHAIGVTVEGRFGDENALYVNGQLRF